MIVICGQEFDFNPLNANDAERMERAQQQLERQSEAEKARAQRECGSLAELIRGQCRAMMDYLDTVLGEDASARLGLDGSDLDACATVFAQLEKAMTAAYSGATDRMSAPLNRAQRRAKKKHHKPPVNHPQPPAAQMVERVDKAARRKALLAQLAALDDE